MIADPPLELGAVKATLSCVFPGVIPVIAGAPGDVVTPIEPGIAL